MSNKRVTALLLFIAEFITFISVFLFSKYNTSVCTKTPYDYLASIGVWSIEAVLFLSFLAAILLWND